MKQEIYRRYKKVTNMSYSELLTWSNNPCSFKASLDRTPINRNLRLLSKPVTEWTTLDVTNANKTISFIARMRGVSQGNIICGKYSKRDIALKNWGFDPNK